MYPRLLVGLVAVLVSIPAARAAEPVQFQVAPYAGLRVGGSLEDADSGADREFDDGTALALSLELRYEKGDDRFWQLWYSRQGSSVADEASEIDVDIEYLHIGGTVPIDAEGRVHSYLAAGIGATRFSPDGAGLDDLTRFSASLGLGLSVPVSERAAFRIEARGYLTVMDSDTAIFCRSDSGEGFCSIVASGSSLFQAELLAGFAIGF